MDYRQFKDLLEDGTEHGMETIQALEGYVNEFPFFQSAHLLLARSMHEHQHVRSDKQLKIAAAYAGDRKFLYDLIHVKQHHVVSGQPVISESPFVLDSEPEGVVKEEEVTVEEANPVLPPPDEIEIPLFPSLETKADFISLTQNFSNDDEPFADEFNEEPVADPHDIIRKRLVEILGLREEEKLPEERSEDVLKSGMFTPANKTGEKTTVENPDETAGKISSPEISFKHEQREQGSSETKVFPDAEEQNKSFTEKLPEAEAGGELEKDKSGSGKDVLKEIVQESEKPVDFIQAAEIEHALEATLIQSIEKLPVITVKKEAKKADENQENLKPVSFYGWLKIKSTGDYGKIEEVHAYDNDLQKQDEISLEEKPVITQKEPADPEEKTGDISRLIDRFIEAEPRIVPSKAEFYSPVTQAKRSITENEDVVSETLAKIYYQQGNYLKALTSYRKLSLLYPEKLTYFAALISEIENEIINQDKPK